MDGGYNTNNAMMFWRVSSGRGIDGTVVIDE